MRLSTPHLLAALSPLLCLVACGSGDEGANNEDAPALAYCARQVTSADGKVVEYAEIDAYGDRLQATSDEDGFIIYLSSLTRDESGRTVGFTSRYGDRDGLKTLTTGQVSRDRSARTELTTSEVVSYRDGSETSRAPGLRTERVYRDAAMTQLISERTRDADGTLVRENLHQWEEGNKQPTRSTLWTIGDEGPAVISRTFDARGCVITETRGVTSSSQLDVDETCRLLRRSTTFPSDPARVEETTWTYDAQGRALKRAQILAIQGAELSAETVEYDWTVRPRGGLIRRTVSQRERVDGIATTIEGRYDATARTFTRVEQHGQAPISTTVETFNAQDMLTRACVTLPGSDERCATTEYLQTCDPDLGGFAYLIAP